MSDPSSLFLPLSPRAGDMRILTVNTGSSSLKSGLYEMRQREDVLLAAEAAEIGRTQSRWRLADGRGNALADETVSLPDHQAALRRLFAALDERGATPDAIGHRVVHGGLDHRQPEVLTSDVIEALARLVPNAPDHLPQALDAIRRCGEHYSRIPQVVCFDTAFHRDMPWQAQRYPLPARLTQTGIVRYGFHGLSCESIMEELRRVAPAEAGRRVIIAHLGNGASLTAVSGGRSLETTMGFSPAGGLIMGTRSGDLDPGVLVYLLQHGMTPAALAELVNKESGLIGISGTTGDMRELLEREAADPSAAEAIELFCYQARKFLGSLAAVLDGLDVLVFTGGIGEHAASIRGRICAGLEFLGLRLDDGRNARGAAVISADDSPVAVRMMKSDEDLMIARHTARILAL
jgi:acetate kinase